MDTIGTRYKLNMYLLGAIGLWPYTSKKIRRVQTILVSSLLWASVVAQLLTFVTVKYTMHLFLKNIPVIIITMAYTLKYVTFWYQIETVEYLLQQIQYNWNSLNVEAELDIIEKHRRMGKYYTQAFALFAYLTALIIALTQFLPDILNVAMPLNQSRPHEMLFTVEVFLDQQKYFYFIALAASITMLTGATTFSATEGIFFMWLQHAVSLFEIVSYRIKETVTLNPTKKEFCKREFDVPTFANAMEVHQRVLKYHHCIQRKFLPSYLILILLGIVSLSCNLLRLSQLVKSLVHIGELLITGVLLITQLAYMYYLSYVMQQLSDSSNEIFRESYNSKWYETPVDTQKQLLFVMSCNVEGVNLNMYGLFDSSVEGFATLLRISVSYFMALRSIR